MNVFFVALSVLVPVCLHFKFTRNVNKTNDFFEAFTPFDIYLFQLSPDQLFFLNFAQVWCGTARLQALRSFSLSFREAVNEEIARIVSES